MQGGWYSYARGVLSRDGHLTSPKCTGSCAVPDRGLEPVVSRGRKGIFRRSVIVRSERTLITESSLARSGSNP
jgi:hypothetical protein